MSYLAKINYRLNFIGGGVKLRASEHLANAYYEGTHKTNSCIVNLISSQAAR